jgi:hypothetical protein
MQEGGGVGHNLVVLHENEVDHLETPCPTLLAFWHLVRFTAPKREKEGQGGELSRHRPNGVNGGRYHEFFVALLW